MVTVTHGAPNASRSYTVEYFDCLLEAYEWIDAYKSMRSGTYSGYSQETITISEVCEETVYPFKKTGGNYEINY
jgi:hypothetical protein